MRIGDRFQQIAKLSVSDIFQTDHPFWIQLYYNRIMGESPTQTELRWATLTPERARENRRRLLGWQLVNDSIFVQKKHPPKHKGTPFEELLLYTVPIAAHGFEMLAASLAAVVVFGAAGRLFIMQFSTISRWALAGTGLFVLGYFLICRIGDYSTINLICGADHYTLDAILISATLCMSIGVAKPISIYIIAFAAVLFFISVIAYCKWNQIHPVLGRLFMITGVFLLAIALLLQFTPAFFRPVFDFIVHIFVIPLLCMRYRKNSTLNRSEFFGRCFALAVLIAAIYLAGFALFSRPLMVKANREVTESTRKYNRTPVYPARYAVSEEDYAALLKRFETEDLSRFSLSMALPLLDPQDIQQALSILNKRIEAKKKPQPFVGFLSSDGMPPMKTITLMRIPIWNLSGLIWQCGKDAKLVILSLMEPSDSEAVLFHRAWAGDPAVRQTILKRWKYYRDAGFQDSEEDPNTIIQNSLLDRQTTRKNISVSPAVLAAVCPYEEFRDYYLEYLNATSQKYGDWNFTCSVLEQLTQEQKGDLINHAALIPRRLELYHVNDFLSYNASISDLVKRNLWQVMIDLYNNPSWNNRRCALTIREKPYAPPPDDRVAQLANSRNADLRAMAQHLYRHKQQPIDASLLEKWRQDSSFIVRATATLLRPEQRECGDPHPFVRLLNSIDGRSLPE